MGYQHDIYFWSESSTDWEPGTLTIDASQLELRLPPSPHAHLKAEHRLVTIPLTFVTALDQLGPSLPGGLHLELQRSGWPSFHLVATDTTVDELVHALETSKLAVVPPCAVCGMEFTTPAAATLHAQLPHNARPAVAKQQRGEKKRPKYRQQWDDTPLVGKVSGILVAFFFVIIVMIGASSSDDGSDVYSDSPASGDDVTSTCADGWYELPDTGDDTRGGFTQSDYVEKCEQFVDAEGGG